MSLLRRQHTALTPARFDAATDRWRDQTTNRAVECRQLTVATFNIWFNDFHAAQRYQAIASILSEELPDVMVFQEVTRPALDILLAQSWVRQHYWQVFSMDDQLGNYGMLMLSRIPIRQARYTRLPTNLARGYLTAEFTINGAQQAIVSVHLESGKSSARLRAKQMACLIRAFRRTGNVILLGDFNLRDGESQVLPSTYRDLWPILRPDEPGYTEDTTINHMRFDSKNKHRHVRFDRVLIKGAAWSAEHIELLGREPVSPSLPRVFPSDHFGVLCRMVVQQVPGGDRLNWWQRRVARQRYHTFGC